jgi:hypothetical protein
VVDDPGWRVAVEGIEVEGVAGLRAIAVLERGRAGDELPNQGSTREFQPTDGETCSEGR